MKTAYKYNDEGLYVGEIVIYESPREPGVYPQPPMTTLLKPASNSDKFINGAWVTQEYVRTVDDAVSEKTSEVDSKFSDSTSGQISVNGLTFDHGLTSIVKIFLAIQKSEKMGETERLIYEYDETPHIMSISEAYEVATTIGDDYDNKDALMRAYKKQVTDVLSGDDSDDVKIATIDAITITYDM